MDDANAKLAENLVSRRYIKSGIDGLRSTKKLVKNLLANRKIPEVGWHEGAIDTFMSDLSRMDSNNFPDNIGVGEREGRILSHLVSRRHFYLAHGMGRSGDIAAEQPKAAGSSLIVRLANCMALDYIHLAGIKLAKRCQVMPVATGMCFTLCLLALRTKRPGAKFVIWPRCDQKSCFKAILTSGFVPVVIENILVGDELQTDKVAIKRAIEERGASNIVCVATTTSCFSPRVPNDVVFVSEVCKQHGIPHIINNAYGLQSSRCCHLINTGCRVGRVDAIIQSTDKNLLVPVGGSLLASPKKDLVDDVVTTYPGRASISPILDIFITLLHTGRQKLKALLAARKEVYKYMRQELSKWAKAHDERVLEIPHNTISIGVTVDSIAQTSDDDPTMLGSMLFNRCVSGTRIVHPGVIKKIGPVEFKGYGSHCNEYPHTYFTAAAAIGVTNEDVDVFVSRLTKAMREIKKRKKRKKRDAKKGSQSKPAADAKVVDCDEKRPSGAGSALEMPAQSASAATATR